MWFKVDDGFALHPKVIALPLTAVGVWVRGGSWCAQHLTDGHLPRAMLAVFGGTAEDAQALVAAGLWTEERDGWAYHDWRDYQPTRQKVLTAREQTADRVRKWRERQSDTVTDTPRNAVTPLFGDAVTDPVRNAVSNGQRNGATNAPPDPTRPVKSKSAREASYPQAERGEGDPDRLDQGHGASFNGAGLQRIAGALGTVDSAWARRVAADILSRAESPPANSTAYVLAAIRAEPARYRQTPTPPPLRDLFPPPDERADPATAAEAASKARHGLHAGGEA